MNWFGRALDAVRDKHVDPGRSWVDESVKPRTSSRTAQELADAPDEDD